jgi:hypothetical protein
MLRYPLQLRRAEVPALQGDAIDNVIQNICHWYFGLLHSLSLCVCDELINQIQAMQVALMPFFGCKTDDILAVN